MQHGLLTVAESTVKRLGSTKRRRAQRVICEASREGDVRLGNCY